MNLFVPILTVIHDNSDNFQLQKKKKMKINKKKKSGFLHYDEYFDYLEMTLKIKTYPQKI